MTRKTALITGVTGQDGRHLTELLLSKNYDIVGVINGQRNDRAEAVQNEFPELRLEHADLADQSSLVRVLNRVQPDEIYNLGAISFVGLSFKQPELTANVTGLGPLRLLEAVRTLGMESSTRIYQASSSEMFGKVRQVPQTELTPFHPRSPYGVAKAFAHQICVNYRESYGMYIACGILFNHEGERRGHEFVTRKISHSVAQIARGQRETFALGTLEPKRDWGYAGDYVRAMWLMLQHQEADDFVIATGETHTVREFVEAALAAAGLPVDVERYVTLDPQFSRPAEVDLLIGDASKAKSVLGWEPTIRFEELVKLMVESDLKQH